MSWIFLLQLVILIIIVALVLSAMVSSWIDAVYKGKTQIKIGETFGWREVRLKNDAE